MSRRPALLLISTLAAVPVCGCLEATRVRPADQYFDSNGVTIRYIDVGPRDAEPIVLIHAFSQRIEMAWVETGIVDALDDDNRIIALDCRGHGKSGKPHDPRQYGDEMAADVIRLLDHLGIEKAHVAGYSMGGRIAFKLVADHADRVLSAVPGGDDGRPASGAFEEAIQRTVTSLEESGSIRPILDYFIPEGSITDEEIERVVAAQRDANDAEALAAVYRGWPGLDAAPRKLEASSVPCLAVIGEGDPLRAGLEATRGLMDDLEVEIVEGNDHTTTFMDPAFARAIRSFVRKHAEDPR